MISAKKKICFVMPFHISQRGGGAEVQAWLYAKELAKRNYDVYYVAKSQLKKFPTFNIIDNVKIFWIKETLHFEWLNSFKYYKTLNKIKPDIIVQRMTSFITGLLGLYTSRNKNKFIWICTGDPIPQKWYFIKRQKLLTENSKKFFIIKLIFLLNAFITDLARNYGMMKISVAFTQNEKQHYELKKSYRINSEKILPCTELPENYIENQSKLNEKIILWVSNLSLNKQPESFIELAKLFDGMDYKFVMIGNRNDKLFTENLFAKAPENFIWLGKLSYKDTLHWFDKASVFVNTSGYEGFPNTFAQAWIRGIPVITLGIDPDSLIKTYTLGFVTHSLDEMKEKILELITNNALYTELNSRIKKYAIENLTVGKAVNHFISIIEK